MTDHLGYSLCAAWPGAHDFNPDRVIGATSRRCRALAFFVNSAAQAADSALATPAEMRWMNGWSTAATFEGEFSPARAFAVCVVGT